MKSHGIKLSRKINLDQEIAIDALTLEATVAKSALPAKVKKIEDGLKAVLATATAMVPQRIASSVEKKGIATDAEVEEITKLRDEIPAVFEHGRSYTLVQLKAVCLSTKDTVKQKLRKDKTWTTISQSGTKDSVVARLIYRGGFKSRIVRVPSALPMAAEAAAS